MTKPTMGSAGAGYYVDSERVLEFKSGCFQWQDGSRVVVSIGRHGVRVGCKTVSWEAWDEIKRLVGEM